ncbi:MAG: hypothetical protein SAL07_16025 [Oscillatoria sp. PMC 1051.18]|uniref:hypothetical protein n=1 Tax=Oscillatoria salina TaxID=331517 RepID=UPI0013BA6A66|nr:hypothetical protein [Oscillatoria salina]MBZ8183024.1 hypothetical protein [Oscillatoria salina IIICB1]MEC4894845.1 hypothetical protein [Oscillatoria sp. PMC 1050.18]MEC5031407.1 hypothetical protein [Oscillatoria sp. PMC 1051.18]NET86615.1 hypothetical protein [Kamptonema sp. SIO1D9]
MKIYLLPQKIKAILPKGNQDYPVRLGMMKNRLSKIAQKYHYLHESLNVVAVA